MGKALLSDNQGDIGEITTPVTLDQKLSDVIKIYNAVVNPPVAVVKAHRDTSLTIRYKTFIHLLICLYGLKKASKAMVIKYSTRNNVFVGRAIDEMYNAGYLVIVPVARYIKPFNRHKIDTHYSLSDKGLKALTDYVSACLAEV